MLAIPYYSSYWSRHWTDVVTGIATVVVAGGKKMRSLSGELFLWVGVCAVLLKYRCKSVIDSVLPPPPRSLRGSPSYHIMVKRTK